MRDLSIIIAFIAIILSACGPKENTDKDAVIKTATTDVGELEDTSELPTDATETNSDATATLPEEVSDTKK